MKELPLKVLFNIEYKTIDMPIHYNQHNIGHGNNSGDLSQIHYFQALYIGGRRLAVINQLLTKSVVLQSCKHETGMSRQRTSRPKI